MFGYMSGAQFGRRVGWRIGLFVALTVGFPFIIYAVVLGTGANRVARASGAMAAIVGLYLKPVMILVFLISMVSPCWKRMRSLGIGPAWGLLVPLLLALDYSYLFVIGNFWGASFAMGFLSVSKPVFALTALALIVALGFAASPPSDSPGGLSRFGWPGKALAAVAVAVLLIGLASAAMGIFFSSMVWVGRVDRMVSTYRLVSTYLIPIWLAKPYVCAVLGATALWLAYLSRRDGDEDHPQASISSASGAITDRASSATFGKR